MIIVLKNKSIERVFSSRAAQRTSLGEVIDSTFIFGDNEKTIFTLVLSKNRGTWVYYTTRHELGKAIFGIYFQYIGPDTYNEIWGMEL